MSTNGTRIHGVVKAHRGAKFTPRMYARDEARPAGLESPACCSTATAPPSSSSTSRPASLPAIAEAEAIAARVAHPARRRPPARRAGGRARAVPAGPGPHDEPAAALLPEGAALRQDRLLRRPRPAASLAALAGLAGAQLVAAGMEAHVCVLQTRARAAGAGLRRRSRGRRRGLAPPRAPRPGPGADADAGVRDRRQRDGRCSSGCARPAATAFRELSRLISERARGRASPSSCCRACSATAGSSPPSSRRSPPTGDVPVADLTHDDSVAGMAARVLAAAPPRFALAGLSMGGYVALEIVRQAPERVTRLALLDTQARADTRRGHGAPPRADRAGPARASSRASPRACCRCSSTPTALADAALTATVRAMAEDTGKEAFLRQQTRHHGPPRQPPRRCRRSPARRWSCAGREDALTPPDLQLEMAAAIPDATLVLTPALRPPRPAGAARRRWPASSRAGSQAEAARILARDAQRLARIAENRSGRWRSLLVRHGRRLGSPGRQQGRSTVRFHRLVLLAAAPLALAALLGSAAPAGASLSSTPSSRTPSSANGVTLTPRLS